MDLKEKNVANQNPNRHPWEQARLKVIKRLLLPLLQDKPGAQVMDIGSGDLYVANELAQTFPTSHFYCIDEAYGGIQPDIKNNISICISLKEAEIHLKKPVNFVLLLDVIEHMSDDRIYLEEFCKKTYISNNTIFIITVPAFPSLFTSHDKHLGHYRRYTLRSAKQRLQAAGLSVTFSSYFFFSLIFPRLIKKWSEGKQEKFEGVGNWKRGKLITKCITGILYADALICLFLNKTGIQLPGLSLCLICRKPA